MPTKFVPPANFAPVERHLYRSAVPLPVSFPFIRLLGVRTIIWLSVEDPSDEFLDFVDSRGIRLEHLGLLTEHVRPWDLIGNDVIEEALAILMDTASFPVLICCSMGRHRTGAVVGCLRKLQGWSFSSLVDEYQRFTGLAGERTNVELLIEDFNLGGVREILRDRHASGQPVPAFLEFARS